MRTGIVDFHVHPFLSAENYICQYKANYPMDPDRFREYLTGLGVTKVCGSVAAHPGEKEQFLRHLDCMERFENYYLDLSGSGLGRMGLLRCGIDRVGKDRFLFGTDFPVCPPHVYIAAVEEDPLLSQEEKQAVFHDNALRLLR